MACIASDGRPRRFGTTVILAAVPCLFAGCVSNEYELEMTVEGETLHRRLVCSTAGGSADPPDLQPMPDGELEQIAGAYGVETPENGARKFEFSGDFTHHIPDDLGGFGTLTMYEAELGRTWMYVERFRGEDELTTTLAEREQCVDQVIDAVIHWLGEELLDTHAFDQAREFLDGPLRHDLHNVAAYAWLAMAIDETGAGDNSENGFEILVRLGQFGLERDYLSPSDLPAFVQVANEWDGAALLTVIRGMLASKLGPEAAVDEWNFLDSPQSVVASINKNLRGYPPYEAHVREWRGEHENRDPSGAPGPADWAGGLALRALGMSLGGADVLHVKLHCPTRPFRTNGDWTDDEGVIAWDEHLTPQTVGSQSRQSVLPVVLFAFWSVPDDAVQTEHFGRVVLRDERLAEYVIWREALPDAEAAEWEEFISGLRPNTILQGRIKVFRFSSDPPDDESGTVLSKRGRQLLLSGLDDES